MLSWPSSFSRWLEHSVVKVSPTLTVPDHHIAPSVAVLPAHEWHPRVRQEERGDGEREAGCRRVFAWSNASLTLNALWQVSAASPEAISCIWHMHLCGTSDWPCDFPMTFLAELLLLVRLPPQDSQMHLALSALNSHSTCWLQNSIGNQTIALGTTAKVFFTLFLRETDDVVYKCLGKGNGQNNRNTRWKWPLI